MPQTWLALEDLLSPAELTVRAQTIPPNDMGKLIWDEFFSREDVNSVELNHLTALDYRPAADRREWNARGRRIPMILPTRHKVNIVPIEANDQIMEQEIQRLSESANGNADVVRQAIGATIPARVDRLAESVYRRLEVDAMTAWSQGKIVQKNPETGQTFEASFDYDSDRYTTELTAWDDAGLNAYNKLLAWITAAEDLVGPIEGVMIRLATLNAILADAPNLPNSVVMTRSQIEERITQDKGGPFNFYLNENSVDVFDDGGAAYTRTKIWPAETIAAVPVGRKIGRVAFAPVVRAFDLVEQLPDAGIDVRGTTVYYEAMNGGRGVSIECQLNALPIPEEQLLYVTDVGV